VLRPCLRGTVECRYHEREGRAWLRGGKATTPLYVHALIASACTLSDGGPAVGSSAKVIPIRAKHFLRTKIGVFHLSIQITLPSPSLYAKERALTHMMSERSNPHHRNGERLPALSLTVEPLPVLTHRNE